MGRACVLGLLSAGCVYVCEREGVYRFWGWVVGGGKPGYRELAKTMGFMLHLVVGVGSLLLKCE